MRVFSRMWFIVMFNIWFIYLFQEVGSIIGKVSVLFVFYNSSWNVFNSFFDFGFNF